MKRVLAVGFMPLLVACGSSEQRAAGTGGAGNSDAGGRDASGRDTTPPVLDLPAEVTTLGLSVAGTPVSFTATAVDAVDGEVAVTCDPNSGDSFPVGETLITCSASDASGNRAKGSFNVTVTNAAVDVDTGGGHTCAALADGTVWCWGSNGNGQLGNGSTNNSSTPVRVADLTSVVKLSAGGVHTCAVLLDGSVRCWGGNGSGELGDGTEDESTTPVTTSFLSDPTSISAGSTHTCAVLKSGGASCWGYYNDGNGSTLLSANTPQLVAGLAGASQISAGEAYSCAISENDVLCWGRGGQGQFGGYPLFSTEAPQQVLGSATFVAAGPNHACAVLSSGEIECWGGSNFYGQLGDGTNDNQTSPRTVQDINTGAQVATAYQHSCALLTDGTLRCWGANTHGKLGDGTRNDSNRPVLVRGGSGPAIVATDIDVGDSHSCAVLTDGNVACWGGNDFGEVGLSPGNSTQFALVVSGLI